MNKPKHTKTNETEITVAVRMLQVIDLGEVKDLGESSIF